MLSLLDTTLTTATTRHPTHTKSGVDIKLRTWMRAQLISAERHAESLRCFRESDYASGPAAPKLANLRAVNSLLEKVYKSEGKALQSLRRAAQAAETTSNEDTLANFMRAKSLSQKRIRTAERIWMFYENLFEQRAGPFAQMLLALDRIAGDCYQSCYMGLGVARSIPTPPPYTYVEAGYGPATFRRGVLLSKLGRRANPFPLVKIPHHRLINPWALGAVPHEIGHNLQNDLRLWTVIPARIENRLRRSGIPEASVGIWRRWHKEMYADLLGVLLIGPSYVSSLMDVVAKSPERVARFNSSGVHPTSYLRPSICTALLKRMDFEREANLLDRMWKNIYPRSTANTIPSYFMSNFDKAMPLVVDTICFEPNQAYGGRCLADVTRFRPQDALNVNEAASRLAKGIDPGILPERFYIAAVRVALSKKLASPARLADNFYNALTRR